FVLDAPTRVRLSLFGLTEDANLYLVADLNGNGAWDGDETIDYSTYYDVNPESFLEDLAPGTYYIWVQRRNTADNTAYRLSVSAEALPANPAVDPGATLVDAYPLGTLSTDQA